MLELRTVDRRTPTIIAAAFFALALTWSAAAEAQYVVTATTDDGTGSTVGTLSNAILQANATGGTITFNLTGGATSITLTGSMYGISATAPITIDGGAGITINAAGFQAFTVNSGNVDFQNLAIDGAAARGQAGGNGNGGGGGGAGLGGAIYVDPNAGAIGIQNVTFTNNQAIGGAGGNGNGSSANGGDGGGYNGNAGPNTAPSGSTGGAGAIGSGDGTSGGYGGGGGGGSAGATTPALGNGGGNGGLSGQGGNGGLGLGGAVFIGNGGTTTIRGGTLIGASNTAIGGAGGTGTSSANNGTAGISNGGGLYVGITSTAIFDNSTTDITVTGNIFSNGFIAIQGSGTGVVNFLGTTVTSTASNPSAGIFVNSGTLNGTTDGISGPVTNDSIVRFTQTGLGTFNGQMSGVGRVDIEGGGTVRFDETDTLTTLNTNTFTYTGTTNVNNGTLFVGTNMSTSAVNVASTGTLAGDGSLIGDLTNSGIVAPGDAGIGTLSVAGVFTSNAGSTLQIEINNAGTTPGTNSDLVTVGGNVTLNGGTVAVQTTGGTYTPGTQYRFLNYSGSRTGTFAGATTNSAFLGADIFYDDLGQSIGFTLVSNGSNYASVAQTLNQRDVANYLDANSIGASGSFATFLNQLSMLDAASARTALNQVSGEAYGTSAQVQFQSTTMQLQLLTQHISSIGDAPLTSNAGATITNVSYDPDGDDPFEFVCRSDNRPSTSYWTTGYGLGGSAEGDGNASGLRYGQGGALVGADHWLGDATLVGLYGGYNYARFDGDTLPQNVKASSGQFGGYLRRNFSGGRHALLAGGFGFDSYESMRTYTVGNIASQAAGNYDGWQSVAYGEYGRALNVGRGRLTPYAGLQYIYLRRNGFMESGAGPANLTVAGIDAHSLRNVLGVRFDRTYRARLGRGLTPQVRAAWLHEYLDTATVASNRFVGVGGTSFAAQGLDLGRDWALLGAGLNWQLTTNWSLAANYDSQINQNQTFHAGSGTLTYVW